MTAYVVGAYAFGFLVWGALTAWVVISDQRVQKKAKMVSDGLDIYPNHLKTPELWSGIFVACLSLNPTPIVTLSKEDLTENTPKKDEQKPVFSSGLGI